MDQEETVLLKPKQSLPSKASYYHLDLSLQTLPGIGEKGEAALKRLGCRTFKDLLYHLPSYILERPFVARPQFSANSQLVRLIATIESHTPPAKRPQPHKVRVFHESGCFIQLLYFQPLKPYQMAMMKLGDQCMISGVLERSKEGGLQIVHPDYVVSLKEQHTIPEFEPIYPLTYGITQKQLRRWVKTLWQWVPELPEWSQEPVKRQWPTWREALYVCHNPQSLAEALATHPARERLAYDELLAHQLGIRLAKIHLAKENKGIAYLGSGMLIKALLALLPFTLTSSQQQVIAEIHQEQSTPERMMRLLQGDVGSGKTIVALFAMLHAIEAGAQAAFMVPTDILANQHYHTILKYLETLPVKVGLLTGNVKGKDRRHLLEKVASGEINLLIGTHALFQEQVKFASLGFVAIDEQHRFGVEQRLMLATKGEATDVLLMTATPIPRTLALTLYGDMVVSKLEGKPAGRKPILTKAVPLSRIDEVIESLLRALNEGNRIYWICPFIEALNEEEVTQEKRDLAAAEARFAEFQEILGNKVSLMHGRMKAEEREAAMGQFARGESLLLIATTVVEVGIDVPEASIIIIEHAERFGLAQLHQLRGRVGRGEKASSCILLYGPELSDVAKSRLNIMRQTEDGFLIAEEDLRLRGGGEVLGTRQSGHFPFRYVDPEAHIPLMNIAAQEATFLLGEDPELKKSEAQQLLLELFGYSHTMKFGKIG